MDSQHFGYYHQELLDDIEKSFKKTMYYFVMLSSNTFELIAITKPYHKLQIYSIHISKKLWPI
jgi:hypothetical protein